MTEIRGAPVLKTPCFQGAFLNTPLKVRSVPSRSGIAACKHGVSMGLWLENTSEEPAFRHTPYTRSPYSHLSVWKGVVASLLTTDSGMEEKLHTLIRSIPLEVKPSGRMLLNRCTNLWVKDGVEPSGRSSVVWATKSEILGTFLGCSQGGERVWHLSRVWLLSNTPNLQNSLICTHPQILVQLSLVVPKDSCSHTLRTGQSTGSGVCTIGWGY